MFHAIEDGRLAGPKREVVLVQLPPRRRWLVMDTTFRFEDRFVYLAPDGAVVHVRGPFETDLASVPPQLWSVIASYGRQTLAAVMHDRLCEEARLTGEDGGGALRRRADRLFRWALHDSRLSGAEAWLMWSAVWFAGTWEFARIAAVALGAVLLAVAWLLWSALLGAGSTAVAAAAGAVLLAVWAAGTMARRTVVSEAATAVGVGAVASVPVLVLLLVNTAATLLLAGGAVFTWLLDGITPTVPRAPGPDAGATVDDATGHGPPSAEPPVGGPSGRAAAERRVPPRPTILGEDDVPVP